MADFVRGQVTTWTLDVSELPESCLQNINQIVIREKSGDGWTPEWLAITTVDSIACETTKYLYEVFVSSSYFDPAYASFVRNFIYQTFEDLPFCEDPCAWRETCTTFVDSCAITPAQNNLRATFKAALNYKFSVDVLCGHSSYWAWRNIIEVNKEYSQTNNAAGYRQFAIYSVKDSPDLEITVNDPTKNEQRLRFYRSCVSGEWNTYSVIVRQVPDSLTTLRYVLRIDAVEVANGTYDVSQAYAIGDLYAMVSNNYDATSAQNEVRNFYFQRFEDRNIFQMANIAWIEKSNIVDQSFDPAYFGLQKSIKGQAGAWHYFSIHQREIQPGKLLRTFKHNDIIYHEDLSYTPDALYDRTIYAHLFYDRTTSGELAGIRNFYLETIDSCVELCDNLTRCTTKGCSNSESGIVCTCPSGYQSLNTVENDCDNYHCFDTDECLDQNSCPSANEICENTIGSFLCNCMNGFLRKNGACEDINECEIETHNCPVFSTCKNLNGSFECFCNPGFLEETCSGFSNCQNLECVDEDECSLEPCDQNMICSNTIGSYSCDCVDGMKMVAGGCSDIDECEEENACPEYSICKNFERSFECFCQAGFDGGFCFGEQQCSNFTCFDIDECESGEHLCEEICINTIGSFTCSCPVPMRQVDLFKCEDVSFDGNKMTEMEDEELQKMMENELGSIHEKMQLALKFTNDSKLVSEAIGEASARTGNLLSNLLAPKTGDDSFLKEIGSSSVDLLLEKSESIVSIRTGLNSLLEAISDDSPSTEFIVFGENISIPILYGESRSRKNGLLAEIKFNPFIYSDDDLRLANQVLYSSNFEGYAQMRFKQEPKTIEKSLLPGQGEVVRFDLENNEDFFVFFDFDESIYVDVFVDFWYKPDPKLLSYRHHVTLPSFKNASELSATKCTVNVCSGDPYGIHFEKKEVELCFSRQKCSIFILIKSNPLQKDDEKKEETKIKITSVSASCVTEKSQKWNRDFCAVMSDSTAENIKCSCEISSGDKITSRAGGFTTVADYYTVFVNKIITVSMKLFPVLLGFLWMANQGELEYTFLEKSESYENGLYQKLTKSVLDRKAITNLVYRSKHKTDFYITLRRFISYLFLTLSLYGLSTVILPTEKYYLDKNFRDKISIVPSQTQLNVSSTWDLIQDEIVPLIHSGNLSNGEKASVKDKAYARDSVNFRLGPASLIQHRDQCGFFTTYWNPQLNVTERVIEKVKKSPLLSSYFSKTKSFLSSDIFLQTPSRLSRSTCAFTSILGTSKESADYMTNYLRKNAWFDQNTKLLIFEQSFLNMNINAFAQFRVVFEFAEGGAIIPSLTIQQLKNVELTDYTFSFNLIVFIALLLYETIEIFSILRKREVSFLSLYKIMLTMIDVVILAFIILRSNYLSEAIDNFNLDPKGAPTFSKVFLIQHHFISLVAMSLFLHSFLLIHILSTLNAVRQYKSILKQLKRTLAPFVLALLPIQFGLSSVVFLIFRYSSFIFRSLWKTFFVIIWQGYLKPSDMRVEVDELPDPNWRLLAKFIYFALNLSMMYLTMNVIVAIICDTNQSVKEDELELDWLSLVSEKIKKLRRKAAPKKMNNMKSINRRETYS
ncbi:Oidioi.mRNA.OKI2018_I69.chr1.g1570.t1.cds [Oikopleura dioica]|uniref:Oidioi.mRNA.OKI2018_I69.chr1.g1570.t1.cds n=1 Tax=Oikopleura dioica TaxID=34765 RepID=A0ABN7SUN1_OIKDI|nr:Oidioi.mRNA.OKI2018_I69.chr1.g1570.t1.cds [Oikopleura dioica]